MSKKSFIRLFSTSSLTMASNFSAMVLSRLLQSNRGAGEFSMVGSSDSSGYG